ncbi:hypothetical protein F4Z99_17420 [Candidatus Poribacteria bacterium]|nr:hypothetical protein [Candidatus Poribacteria bacterium]
MPKKHQTLIENTPNISTNWKKPPPKRTNSQQLAQRYRNQVKNRCTFEDWCPPSVEGWFWYGYGADENGISTIVSLNTGKERKLKLNYCSLPDTFYRDQGLDTCQVPHHFRRDSGKSFITFELFENKKHGKLLQRKTIEDLIENSIFREKEPYTLAQAQAAAQRWASKFTSGTYRTWGRIWAQIWKQVNQLPKFHAQVDDMVLSVKFTPYQDHLEKKL